MKKLLVLLTTIILTQIFNIALSQDNTVYNLHSNKIYMIDLDIRPMGLQITNPKIIKTSIITDIFSTNSQILIETIEEGISYISYKAKDKSYTIKILVDNNSKPDETLIEIDRIEENNSK